MARGHANSWAPTWREDTGQVTIEHRLTNFYFYCFPRSFALLFPIVLHQLCLLHQVGAYLREQKKRFIYRRREFNSHTLFSCKHFLLFQQKWTAAGHKSEKRSSQLLLSFPLSAPPPPLGLILLPEFKNLNFKPLCPTFRVYLLNKIRITGEKIILPSPSPNIRAYMYVSPYKRSEVS